MGTEQWGVVALGGFLAFISNVLYMWGGTEMTWGGQKWLRRFLASFVLALSANLVALFASEWTWKYLLMWPCLIGGFSLGYGGDNNLTKMLKRGIYALGVLSACFIGLWATSFSGFGIMVFCSALVIGAVSIVFGVWNPFGYATLEQFLICQLLTLFIPFWSMVK